MPLFDLPLARLRAYRAASEPPQDLAAFWRRTLQQSRAESFPLRATPVDTVVANLAPFATTPALFSVALLDTVCPPSTVFAAFHRHGATDKDIVIYPDNGHEGGGAGHDERSLRWLSDRLA